MAVERQLPTTSGEISPVLTWLAWYLARPQVAAEQQSIALLDAPKAGSSLEEEREHTTELHSASPTLSPETSPAPHSREIQQIPTEGDKLLIIINFLLREVLPLRSRADQEKLLKYYFGALVSETMFSAHTALGYTIVLNPLGELKLYDDIYQLSPDVATVCQAAMAGVSDVAEKRRYQLEYQQTTALIEKIATLFTAGYPPHALIDVITTATDNQPTQQPESSEVFQAFGWVPAAGLISPEAARKLELPACDLPCFAGRKIVYVMPQSEVHKGNRSMLVVAQPVFIPQLNRLVLLHDQYAYGASWQEHIDLMKRLKVSIPPDIDQLIKKHTLSQTEVQTVETFVMSQIVTLTEWQTHPAKAVLEHLTPKQGPITRLKEWWRKKKLQAMEESIGWYATLVIELMEQEIGARPLNTSDIAKLSLFLKRIVLTGLLTQEKLTQAKLPELLALYQEHAHQSEENFVLAAASKFSFAAALRGVDTSLLECVSIGTITGFGAHKLFANLQLRGGSISQKDVSSIVGPDRAAKWQPNSTCSGCGAEDTWVGECGLCLECEVNSSNQSADSVNNSAPLKEPEKVTQLPPPKKTKPLFPPPSASVGNFVASFV